MNWMFLVLLLPLALAEIGELSPWLASRCIRAGTRMLSKTRARQRFAEEWCAGMDRVPGKLTKLCFAAGIVAISVPALRLRDWRAEREVPGMRRACEYAISALNDAESAQILAESIAYAGPTALGFRSAAVSLARPGGSLETVAAAGPAAMREQMIGKTFPQAVLERAFLASEKWGTLRFLTNFAVFSDSGVAVYTSPRGEARRRPDDWDTSWGLMAPLLASDGQILGMISLDEPLTGRCPGMAQRSLLEAYAAWAARQLAQLSGPGAG